MRAKTLSAFSTLILIAHIPPIKAEDSEIEELVVTAQKRSEKLSSVPLSIDVIGRDFIENAGARGISELEYALPSVNFGRGGRKTRGEIAIRGIGDFSRNIGNNARVAVYIDDVPLSRSSGFEVSLADIHQIEVLKGPQGTLFGTNTVAGAINITSALPEAKFSNTVRVDAGDRDHLGVSVKSNIPFSDTLFSSVQINSVEADGFIDNISLNKELQGTDMDTARIKFLYQPNDRLSLYTSFDWLEEDIAATNAVALADDGMFNGFSASPNPREVAHNTPEFERREIFGGSARVNYQFDSDFELVSITAYRDSEFEEFNEEDYSPLPAVFSTFNEDFKQWSQEFRLLSKVRSNYDFVIGTFMGYQKISTDRSANLSGASVITPGELEATSFALFANVNFRLSPVLEITAGARAQYEDKELDFTIEDNIGLFTNGTLRDDKQFGAFLPKLSLNFSVSDNDLIYWSVARGSKSGGWNADFVTSLENIDFEQEFAINYELGYKGAFLDGNFTTHLAAFFADFDEYQVFQFVTNADTTLIKLTNAGEVTSKGLEFTSKYYINEFVSVAFNATYTRARFDEFKNGGGPGIDYDGMELPYAPEFSAFTAVDFTFPVSDRHRLTAHLDYSYSDGYFSNPNNAEDHQIDNFYTVNGNLGLSLDSRWEISLWGKNITDELYLRNRETSFLGISRGYYEAPRSYGISIKYSD